MGYRGLDSDKMALATFAISVVPIAATVATIATAIEGVATIDATIATASCDHRNDR